MYQAKSSNKKYTKQRKAAATEMPSHFKTTFYESLTEKLQEIHFFLTQQAVSQFYFQINLEHVLAGQCECRASIIQPRPSAAATTGRNINFLNRTSFENGIC